MKQNGAVRTPELVRPDEPSEPRARLSSRRRRRRPHRRRRTEASRPDPCSSPRCINGALESPAIDSPHPPDFGPSRAPHNPLGKSTAWVVDSDWDYVLAYSSAKPSQCAGYGVRTVLQEVELVDEWFELFVRAVGVRGEIEVAEFVSEGHEKVVAEEAGGPSQEAEAEVAVLSCSEPDGGR
jgi:hypothetical protein